MSKSSSEWGKGGQREQGRNIVAMASTLEALASTLAAMASETHKDK